MHNCIVSDDQRTTLTLETKTLGSFTRAITGYLINGAAAAALTYGGLERG